MLRTLAIVLACILSGVACDRLIYSERTTYAPGYTEGGFRRIKVGMSEQEVVALVGPPLTVRTQNLWESWYYYPQVSSSTNRQLLLKTYSFIAPTSTTEVVFDHHGVITNTMGEYLKKWNLIGFSKERLLSSVGKPSRVDRRNHARFLCYSLPVLSGTYKIREVEIDGNNAVSATISEVHYD